MAGVTLDAGVLISAERNELRFWSLWNQIKDLPLVVPAPVLAQVWRGRDSAPLVRVLKACEIEPLDEPLARLVGAVCARSATSDIADAALVVGAAMRRDDIVTTDIRDILRLSATVHVPGRILDYTRLRV